MKDLVPRIISGIVYIALIYFGTTGSPWFFTGLMGLFLIMCFIEYVQITELSDKLYIGLSFLASAGVFYYFTYYLFNAQSAFVLQSMSFAGPVLFLLACFTIMFSSNELYIEFGKATVAVIYIAVPFGLALTIPTVFLDSGVEIISNEILFIFVLIWLSDIMAYVFGSLWGKHPMVPKISKKKTWEGAIGGFIFTVAFGFILNEYMFPDSRVNWIVIGLIVSITAPIGDIIESKLKRLFNAKDSGKLIPGHGGFLDRLDSFIFVVPMVYFYLLLNEVL
ncbi:phosphatidate cytidylyltransferase [Moheibacter sediminis]|uniref:Phosphatidate cytidylyltransferase n=1 Tax=Moheibacter sediminis TaxID=1434700 RepID=A0A1W1Z917_9FLAO|nr:phosphatidate cytidylyltransferase [Moheibacter sediminis]SMC44856.1 phosphatidate cytidylyltransferase [Moheibacter sediminis]